MDCTYTQCETYEPPDWNCSASGRIHCPFPHSWHPIEAVEEILARFWCPVVAVNRQQ
ncbi:hypothetical protein GALMADRAFT_259647 [Galerina marginata CBS 339.88]|uniref:Uncharacterized protein n=1 Tax=Galerina marginata (strain CBS 339.88) TaxID=685588 RepID=A0A067S5R1_GALM3|nr:hypothetical protein GALMADRAFT_259647 [Galerina marginata CBS 339.88]